MGKCWLNEVIDELESATNRLDARYRDECPHGSDNFFGCNSASDMLEEATKILRMVRAGEYRAEVNHGR